MKTSSALRSIGVVGALAFGASSNSYASIVTFAQGNQTVTVDSSAFTATVGSGTFNLPNATDYNQTNNRAGYTYTDISGGTYIPGTLPPQYTPIVTSTVTVPAFTSTVNIGFDASPSVTFGAQTYPLGTPCSGSIFCLSGTPSVPSSLTFSGTFTYSETGYAPFSGPMTETFYLSSSASNYTLDLGGWPNSAVFGGDASAVYRPAGVSFTFGAEEAYVTAFQQQIAQAFGVGSIQSLAVSMDGNGAFQLSAVPDVPLPASGWLLLSGLGGFGLLRRKRTAKLAPV